MIAVIILHLLSLPLVIGVEAVADTDTDVGRFSVRFMAIPILGKKIDIEKIKNRIFCETREDDEAKADGQSDSGQKSGAFKRFLVACAVRILRRVRVRKADLAAKLGTGDAAADGMTVGILRIACAHICAFFGTADLSANISPDYDSTILFFDFFGIFSLCLADIIVAVVAELVARLAHIGVKRRGGYANVAE